MAEGGNMKASFDKFVKDNAATSKDITTFFRDAKVISTKGSCTSNNLDIAYSKVKKQVSRPKLQYKDLDALIAEVAKSYAADHKMSTDDAVKAIKDKLAACEGPAMKGATKQSKTGGVDKMTDASQYTGAHKERFDADGKGKGAAGRTDKADNSGYVGNYKGSGTYDKK